MRNPHTIPADLSPWASVAGWAWTFILIAIATHYGVDGHWIRSNILIALGVTFGGGSLAMSPFIIAAAIRDRRP